MIKKCWEIRVFISDTGNNEIEAWLNAIPKKAKAKIKKIMTYLENEKIWKEPYAKKLSGSDTIWEIRAISDNVQYRPLGCFGPSENMFTLLIGVIKKGKRLDPPNAISTAEGRCALIHQHERYTNEYH